MSRKETVIQVMKVVLAVTIVAELYKIIKLLTPENYEPTKKNQPTTTQQSTD